MSMRYFGAQKRPCVNSDNEDQGEMVDDGEVDGKNILIVNVELPALDLSMHLCVNLSSSKDQQDLLGDVMDSLRDVMSCRNCWDNVIDAESTKSKLANMRLEGQRALADWESQLKTVETWRIRVENAKSQMNAMRENYHKDLQLLRQQLYQKGKAESSGEEYLPDDIFHYDPTQYQFDDEVGALVKEQIERSQLQFEQRLQNEKNKFQHQLAIANDKVQDMMMLLDCKEKLLQALNKRHGGGSVVSTSTMVSCLEQMCVDEISDEKCSDRVRRKSLEAKWKSAFNRLRRASTGFTELGESVTLPPCSRRVASGRDSSVSTVSMPPFCTGGVNAGKNTYTMANKMKRSSAARRKSDMRRTSIQSMSVQSVCSTDQFDDIGEGLTIPCTATVDSATQCGVEEKIDVTVDAATQYEVLGTIIDVAVDSATQCDVEETIDVGVQTQPTCASEGIQIASEGIQIAVSPVVMSEHGLPQAPNQTSRRVASILECQAAQSQYSESERSCEVSMSSSHAPSCEVSVHSSYASEEEHSSTCSTPRQGRRSVADGLERRGLRKKIEVQVGKTKTTRSDTRNSAEMMAIGSVDFQQVCTTTTAADSEFKPGDPNRKSAKPSQNPKGPFSRAARYFRR